MIQVNNMSKYSVNCNYNCLKNLFYRIIVSFVYICCISCGSSMSDEKLGETSQLVAKLKILNSSLPKNIETLSDKNCEYFFINTILITLSKEEDIIARESFDCTDGGGSLSARVGSDYTLKAEGLDQQGNIIYSGQRDNINIMAGIVNNIGSLYLSLEGDITPTLVDIELRNQLEQKIGLDTIIKVGDTVEVAFDLDPEDATASIQWLREGVVISSEKRYELTKEDKTALIEVVVTPKTAEGNMGGVLLKR